MRAPLIGWLSQAARAAPPTPPAPPVEPEITTYRHFRIYVTANNGRSTTNVAELILRTSSGGAQAATGGTPSASSEFSSGYPAAYAFDDAANTFWSTQIYQEAPCWLAYDMGDGNEIAVVEYAIMARATAADGAPRTWELQGSNNGVDWTALDAQTDVTGWSNGETKTWEVT